MPVFSRLKSVVPLVLLLANVFVLLCGLSVIFVGVWALASEREYYSILDEGDTQGTRLPTSLIVAGFFVSLLAAMGLLGVALAKTYLGKLLLGMYAFVLFFLIIMEIGCGAAAIKYRDELESKFTRSASNSQKDYCVVNQTIDQTHDKEWDHFQEKYHCCGTTGYKSYNLSTLCFVSHTSNVSNATNATDIVYTNVDIASVTEVLTVPQSCCNTAELDGSHTNCSLVTSNITQNNSMYIYDRGCIDVVLNTLRHNQLIIAVTSFLIGSVQIVGVLSASLIVYLKAREDSETERKYTRLRHMTMTTTLTNSVRPRNSPLN